MTQRSSSLTTVPTVNASHVASALRDAGVSPGDCLLVHSSLKSFGHVDGGADTVIDCLLEALTPSGTLLMPTHTWATVNPENPIFDFRSTPSVVGLITNTFRLRPGVLRSLHPTHSVAALGPRAGDFIAAHETDVTPCGPHSPYRRLMETSGKIAFLGTGMACNTTLHAIEELAVVPWLFDRYEDLYTIDRDLRKIHVPSLRHDDHLPRSFASFGHLFEKHSCIKTSRAGNASVIVLRARPMRDCLLPLLARDPFLFLTPEVAPAQRAKYRP